jgi:hypothetical protein
LGREHIEQAIHAIESGAATVPKNRESTKYGLYADGPQFPPKYLICLAHKYYEGKELQRSDYYHRQWPNQFGGGNEANNFLLDRQFEIRDKQGNPIRRIETDAHEESSFPEGKALYRLHKSLERDHSLIVRAKEQRRAVAGQLKNDVCDFCFEMPHGPVRSGFIEAHHTIPVYQIKGRWKTKISELALVCSNCHRMLRKAVPISVEGLRTLMVKA